MRGARPHYEVGCLRAPSGDRLLGLLLGCGDTVPLSLEVPIEDGDRALLVLLDRSSGPEVYAIDLLSDPSKQNVRADYTARDGERIHVVAFLYQRSVAELGLTAGRLTLSDSPTALPLPTADRGWVADVQGQEAPAWTLLTGIDPIAARIKIPRTSNCADFNLETFTLTSTGGGSFLVKTSSRDALVGTRGGSVYRVNTNGTYAELKINPPLFVTSASLFGVESDGPEMLFATRPADLWIGTVTATTIEMTFLARDPSGDTFEHMAAERDGSAYLLGHHGKLKRWDGTRFNEIYDFEESNSSGFISQLKDAEAFSAWPTLPGVVLHMRGNEYTEEVFAGGDRIGPRAMHTISRLGYVLGTVDGRVFVKSEGMWRELPNSKASVSIFAFTGHREGFIAGLTGGYLMEWDRTEGFCPLFQAQSTNVEYLERFDDTLLMVSGDMETDTQCTIARRIN